MKSSFEKCNDIMRLFRAKGASGLSRKFKSVGNSQSAQIVLQYTAKNRQLILHSVLNSFTLMNDIGKLNSIIINDSANYVERDEILMRNSTSITHCQSFDEVEDITPVTHGTLVLEVQF